MAAWLKKAMMGAVTGVCVGAGGVMVSSIMLAGRAPPRSQVLGAAAMCGTIFGAGSLVRGR